MDNAAAVTAFSALAQDTRLAVFRLLVQAGPEHGMVASKIAEALDMPASSLSFHLKELSQAGLITPTPNGRFISYAARYTAIDELIAFLTDNCCGGIPCSPPPPACKGTP